jgi:tryptophan halogenase
MIRIIIVGGGSAGWMAAAYLSRTVANADITLIESAAVPTIGVGEATIPPIKRFMEELGLREADWMPACHASYKFAIRFDDWYRRGDRYWHPFEGLPYFNPEHHLAQYWYRHFLDRGGADRLTFYDDAFVGIETMRQNRILKNPDGSDDYLSFAIRDGETTVSLNLPYAFHLDAGLFGAFLKERVALPNGVHHIVDTIDDVTVAENGWIASVTTRTHGAISGDLFVDCSGFRALLAGEALNGRYVSWRDMLFCDRAVALRAPFAAPDEAIAPFTRSMAMDAGWSWRIPLTSRIGTGYVYSSAFLSDDDAEAALRERLGAARVADVTANRVSFRVGTRERHWVGNCVAVGLAAGFIEPLESTALHLVQHAVERIAGILARGSFNAAAVAGFNATMSRAMEEVRDFIIAHYALTAREDTPFWRAVKHETRIPDSLAARLADWQRTLPNRYAGGVFGETSWICILLGMNATPLPHFYQRTPLPELERHRSIIEKLAVVRKALGQHAVDHRFFLGNRFQLK